MVKYITILDVIEKCLSKQRIQEKLALLDDIDKYIMLKPLTNPGELEAYDKMKFHHQLTANNLEYYKNELANGTIPEFVGKAEIERLTKKYAEEEYEIYLYEKRIYDSDFKLKEPKKIDYDISNYKEDVQWDKSEDLYEDYTIGKSEQAIIDQQKNLTLTNAQLSSVLSYYGSGSKIVNSKLNSGETWDRLPDDKKKMVSEAIDKSSRHLSAAINKSEGIKDNIIVYHGGRFDVKKVVGDKVYFRGFTSCSFQKHIGESFGERGWYYRICLPAGSKGLCGNGRVADRKGDMRLLSSHSDEHEFLLDKGFSGDIVDIDYENHMVTIMP